VSKVMRFVISVMVASAGVADTTAPDSRMRVVSVRSDRCICGRAAAVPAGTWSPCRTAVTRLFSLYVSVWWRVGPAQSVGTAQP